MIQVISYEVKKKILIVGFKVDNFVVYSSIGHDTTRTKPQLLQLAYEQVKQTIDYEKTLDEHSITSDSVGEVFVPTTPVVKSIKLDVDKDHVVFEEGEEQHSVSLSSVCLDQYDDVITVNQTYSTSYGDVEGSVLIITNPVEFKEVTVKATVGDVEDIKVIYVTPYIEPVIEYDPIPDMQTKIQEQEQVIEELLFEIIPMLMGGM